MGIPILPGGEVRVTVITEVILPSTGQVLNRIQTEGRANSGNPGFVTATMRKLLNEARDSQREMLMVNFGEVEAAWRD